MDSTVVRSSTRRAALRSLGAAALAAVPMMGLVEKAAAGRTWCRADPVLRIAGQTAHVYITSSVAMLTSATDKIRLTVTLPPGVEGKRVDVLADFGKGYDVRFVSSSTLKSAGGKIPVQIAVYCPARDGTLPVTVEFAPVNTGPLTAGIAAGTANNTITFRAG
jgi:hypothetical protein